MFFSKVIPSLAVIPVELSVNFKNTSVLLFVECRCNRVCGLVVPIPIKPVCLTVNKLLYAVVAVPPFGFSLIVNDAVLGILLNAEFPFGFKPPLFKLILHPQKLYKFVSPPKLL